MIKNECLEILKKEEPDALPMRNKSNWQDCIIIYEEIDKIGVYYDLPDNGFSSKLKLFSIKEFFE